MAGTERTGFTDAALVRRLAPWIGPATEAPVGFLDQLSAWLRWTDAQPLFAALQEPIATPPCAPDEDPSPDSARADSQAVLGLLTRALTDDAPWREAAVPRRRSATSGWIATSATPAPTEMAFDFPTYRRHVVAQQQSMEDRIAPLRARLRRALELRGPAHARLAALDAVMERMLGAPERRLLDALPGLLEKRFAQLRAAATADAETAGDAPAAAAWQTGFQHDLEAALHAELDLRWHPIRALLAALHTPDHAHAVA